MSEPVAPYTVGNVLYVGFDRNKSKWTPKYTPSDSGSLPLPLVIALPDRGGDGTSNLIERQFELPFEPR